MCDATSSIHYQSQIDHGGDQTADMTLILAELLLAVAAGITIEHYIVLRKARTEYERAKEVVEEITLSFGRQLRNEAEKLERVAYRVEALYSKSDGVLKKVDEATRVAHTIEAKAATAVEGWEKLSARIDEMDKKVCDAVVSHATLATRLSTVEEQSKRSPTVPEANIEAAIPIRRDRALAPLTETELSALEILATQGPKMAPEIKDLLKLSREHTARLMKKLYEGGYLERDTSKIPFKYSIKKEMEKLLKRAENEPT